MTKAAMMQSTQDFVHRLSSDVLANPSAVYRLGVAPS